MDGAGTTYGYNAGVISLTEVAPGNGHSISITATETDASGLVSAANNASANEYTPVTAAPAVAISGLVNGEISTATLHGTSTVNATISLTTTDQASLSSGGSIQVSVNDNGTLSNLNLHLNTLGNLIDASGNNYLYNSGIITLTEAAPGNGHTLSITATQTDAAGTISAGATASALENITLPDTPAVAIVKDSNLDHVISAPELGSATTLNTTITLDAIDQTLVSNGGTVQLQVTDNGTTQNLNLHLSGANLVDGSGNTYSYSAGVITLTEAAPGNGNALSVAATVTDIYGNVSNSNSANITEITTLPPAPVSAITTDSNQDGYLSAAELNGTTNVSASITLNATAVTDLANGGHVNITVVDGATTNLTLHYNGTNLVDASNTIYSYSAGVITLSESAPGNGNPVSVSATVTDVYGNVSSGQNTATAIQDVLDAPTISHVNYTTTAPSIGMTLQSWVSNTAINNQFTLTAGARGSGTNPGLLIDALTLGAVPAANSTSVIPVLTSTTSTVATGTASEVSALVYLQGGSKYTFTNGSVGEDDSFALVVGGKLISDTTWGISAGTFSGSFTAGVSGWYTMAAFHDNEAGPGGYSLNVSVNGAAATALSTSGLYIVPDVSALSNAGIMLNPEVMNTTSNTFSITTTNSNSSYAGTVTGSLTGGYYTQNVGQSVTTINLDSNDQTLLFNNPTATMHVTASDGTNATLHWNGSNFVDAGNTVYTYSAGSVYVPVAGTSATPVITVSATITDTHGVTSYTSSLTEVNSGSNSLTELAGGDTFVFKLGANGTAGTPHIETISAFNTNVAANGGDVLNLSDILPASLATASAATIANYLHFTEPGTGPMSTTVHVNINGGGNATSNDTLQIVLNNADLLHSAGVLLSDTQIIANLIANHKIIL